MRNFYLFFAVCTFLLPSRLLSQAGTLDRSFGDKGIQLTKLNQNFAIIHAMAVYDNGNIISGGDNYIIRNNSDGTIDSSFGKNGKSYDISRVVNAIVIQRDNKIVVAANYYKTVSEFTAARFLPNGAADISFGKNGIAKFPVSANTAGIGLQSSGKIIVAGTTTGANVQAVVVRFTANGRIDSAFGNNGLVVLAPKNDFHAVCIVIQPDNKILVACNVQNVNGGACIYRLNANGGLDTSFGDNGQAVAKQLFIASQRQCMILQADGKIVIGGSTNTDSVQFGIMRFSPTGKKDPGFAGNSLVRTGFGKWFSDITGLILQADGKIIAAGSITDYTPGNYGFAAARYLPDGSLDNSFGSDGKISRMDHIWRLYGNCIGLQPGEKIIIGGYADSGKVNSPQRFAFVSRLNNNENIIAANNVKQADIINGIHIYPNPVKDVLHIRNIPERSYIEIINNNGVTVLKKRNVSGQADMPAVHLFPGIYNVRITNGGNVSVQKFLKQ